MTCRHTPEQVGAILPFVYRSVERIGTVWISSLLVAIVLALAVLAFRGVFGKFPDQWEWFLTVLAIVGLAVSAPSVFQMIWGRPKLRLQFDLIVENDDRSLGIHLQNTPVKSRILKKFGVRRDSIQSLTASYQISEAGSGTIIVPVRQLFITTDEEPDDALRQRVALPPTFSVAGHIPVVIWDKINKQANLMPTRTSKEFVLKPGRYLIRLVVMCDGEPSFENREIVIGEELDDMNWVRTN